ncbi:hypothetical protein WA026_005394 [Henosepilachna vigintioctopunctata]|uniref:Phosphatidylinositol-specific phospholipase C X domain-containing protein n=1 Tax=Henosepilachna vigintioctopunctata TaxID=420089 RepID=A0AAW1U5B0_9CUCU
MSFLFGLVFVVTFIVSTKCIGNNRGYACGPLYITVSASPKSYVVLNWHFTCPDPPDTLFLLLTDSKTYEQIQDSVDVKNRRRGTYKTQYVLSREPDFPGNWSENGQNPDLDAQCLPLVVESLRNGNLVDSKCLEIQPTWMSKYGKLRLGSMMIPGTHNSGSWRGQPFLLKNYILCQDRNWWQQLVFGIRYFDVRVGVYDNDEVYLTHGVARCTPLDDELDHVANFLRKSPKEVVVLDFHAFNNPVNFTISNHKIVLDLVRKKLGNFIYPRHEMHYDEGPTLDEVWSTGGRVIISYNRRHIVNENHWLWYEVSRDWGNVIHVDKLQRYIYEKTSRKHYGNPMTVLMAELTPTKLYVFLHPTSSLKNLADDVNPNLGFWLRDHNRSDNVNIIATDFFLGNDMINLAQETNDRKLFRLS